MPSRQERPAGTDGFLATRPIVLAVVFAVVAAALLLGAGAWLIDARRAAGRAEMAAKAERENQTAAQLMAHMLVDWLERRDQWGHGADKAWPADFELEPVAIPTLDAEIRDRIATLSFVRVAILNRSGKTIFSTDREQLGHTAHDPARFERARDGAVVSVTHSRMPVQAFDGQRVAGTAVATFLPLRLSTDRARAPDGVLELVSDVTDISAQTELELSRDAHVLGVVFTAIYLLLVALVSWGARSSLRVQSDLVAAKGAAELSEARFRELTETASDWYWEADARGCLTFVSTGAGHSAQAAFRLGVCIWTDLVLDADAAAGALAERAEIAGRRPFRDLALRSGADDGAARVVLLSGRPVFRDDGVFAGYRGTGRDVTTIHAANQRLVQALDREREVALQQRQFISIAAHEFRTPLTIIDGATQRILRRVDSIDPEDLLERATRIRRAVSRMAETVEKTLNAARIEEGRIELKATSFDLVSLLRAVCQRLQGIAPDFAFSFAPSAPEIRLAADQHLLDQVFTNLLANAMKYSGTCRRVDVAITALGEGAGAEIAVRDYGIGIPADELPKLFTRFYRASTAKGLSGTGIGLSVVKDLVQLHGGSVGVTSEVGAGSRFVVRLPAVPTAMRAA